MMTWLASVARYFNFEALTSSGTECGIEQHYEEDDFDSGEDDLDSDEDDSGDNRDSMTDADEIELESVNSPSQWLGIVYEEEAAHLKERNESLETDEPLLDF